MQKELRNPSKPFYLKKGLILAVITLLAAGVLLTAALRRDTRQEPGHYRGYSKEAYSAWIRSSRYVPVRDGTRLAIDIYRPAAGGKPATEKLPVIWTQTVYHRANETNGGSRGMVDSMPALQTLLKHGYVIAVLDARGTGASFGTWRGLFMPEEAQDAYDITEWLAAQPWCSGSVGMFGGSYLGMTQYTAAAAMPPHLKAIVPAVAYFDVYDTIFPGGVQRRDLLQTWGESQLKGNTLRSGARVDEDREGALKTEALKAHQGHANVFAMFSGVQFRDRMTGPGGIDFEQQSSPFTRLSGIRKSGVPVYHVGGWYDSFTKDTFLYYNNLDNPQKLLMGPWPHMYLGSSFSGLIITEHLKWYDYWLKGIQNGVMEEPSIYYYTMSENPKEEMWKAAEKWPLSSASSMRLYMYDGKRDNSLEEAKGWLDSNPSGAQTGGIRYSVDLSTTSGKATRWTNAYGGNFGYPDMRGNDDKGIAFDTEPFPAGMEVTGHPFVKLFLSSKALDVDIFVYLEDVNEKGESRYITEGVLKASHRALGEASYNNMGLPYHRSFEEDRQKLSGTPVELVLDLHPTSYVFEKGHRLRVNITCADKDNALTSEAAAGQEITLYCGGDKASYITLPVIQAATN